MLLDFFVISNAYQLKNIFQIKAMALHRNKVLQGIIKYLKKIPKLSLRVNAKFMLASLNI